MLKNKDDSLDHADTLKGRIIFSEKKINKTAVECTATIFDDDDIVLAEAKGLHEAENKSFVRDRLIHQLVHGKPSTQTYEEHTATRVAAVKA